MIAWVKESLKNKNQGVVTKHQCFLYTLPIFRTNQMCEWWDVEIVMDQNLLPICSMNGIFTIIYLHFGDFVRVYKCWSIFHVWAYSYTVMFVHFLFAGWTPINPSDFSAEGDELVVRCSTPNAPGIYAIGDATLLQPRLVLWDLSLDLCLWLYSYTIYYIYGHCKWI